MAIFVGALTTAITAAQVYNDPKMYGVEVLDKNIELEIVVFY